MMLIIRHLVHRPGNSATSVSSLDFLHFWVDLQVFISLQFTILMDSTHPGPAAAWVLNSPNPPAENWQEHHHSCEPPLEYSLECTALFNITCGERVAMFYEETTNGRLFVSTYHLPAKQV